MACTLSTLPILSPAKAAVGVRVIIQGARPRTWRCVLLGRRERWHMLGRVHSLGRAKGVSLAVRVSRTAGKQLFGRRLRPGACRLPRAGLPRSGLISTGLRSAGHRSAGLPLRSDSRWLLCCNLGGRLRARLAPRLATPRQVHGVVFVQHRDVGERYAPSKEDAHLIVGHWALGVGPLGHWVLGVGSLGVGHRALGIGHWAWVGRGAPGRGRAG